MVLRTLQLFAVVWSVREAVETSGSCSSHCWYPDASLFLAFLELSNAYLQTLHPVALAKPFAATQTDH